MAVRAAAAIIVGSGNIPVRAQSFNGKTMWLLYKRCSMNSRWNVGAGAVLRLFGRTHRVLELDDHMQAAMNWARLSRRARLAATPRSSSPAEADAAPTRYFRRTST